MTYHCLHVLASVKMVAGVSEGEVSTSVLCFILHPTDSKMKPKSFMKVPGSSISLKINGKEYLVDNSLDADTSLNDFIRDGAGLKGTKVMCREGGCGCCVVGVRTFNPHSNTYQPLRALSSCLVPIYACDKWDVVTVEGLGSCKTGYHAVQQRLADFNGTQCGYCSSGMVMNMYSLMSGGGEKLTMQKVEDSFDGNICRCTGYRPILDAFKSFAEDATPELQQKVADIEEAWKGMGMCPRTGEVCDCKDDEARGSSSGPEPYVHLVLSGSEWYRITDLSGLYNILDSHRSEKVRLVLGNTGVGVYKNDGPYVTYVDLSGIGDLFSYSLKARPMEFGAGLSLTKMIQLLDEASQDNAYSYAAVLAKHIRKIANVPVRNGGSWGGNMMMKHDHPEFPSDVFIALETAGASVKIGSSQGERTLTVKEFLKADMEQSVLLTLYLPPKSPDTAMRTFKVMPRSQNAHAYVNAGFAARIHPETFVVLAPPTFVFGGIRADFDHATQTESFVVNKSLADEGVLQAALNILGGEIQPDSQPADASPTYRRTLAQALFYKWVLGIVGEVAGGRMRSGGSGLERPLSSGKQSYTTDKDTYPISEPIPKVEARAQTSGEAQYVNDIPHFPEELQAAVVTTSVGNANIKNIDPTDALAMPGVVGFVDHRDVRGENTFCKLSPPFNLELEPIFTKNRSQYAGQPIGLILARTRREAEEAVNKVRVEYTDAKKPILSIRDALARPDETLMKHFDPLMPCESYDEVVGKAKYTLEGEIEFGSQHHFYLETQVCICVPVEDGLDIYPASQSIDDLQDVVAQTLGIPNNRINIRVRRLGGAFGGKISRANMPAAACAIAADKFNCPVRLVMNFNTNLEAVGKRLPYLIKYKVGFDEKGKLSSVGGTIYSDVGCSYNESMASFAAIMSQNCYYSPVWHWKPVSVLTNTPSNTWTRAPGTTEGIAIIEHIMEHIAEKLGKDPLAVREINFIHEGEKDMMGKPVGPNQLPVLIQQFKESSQFPQRQDDIKNFNQENRWRKRGLSVVPMKYPVGYPPFFKYGILVSVYHQDGTVAVEHGGIEMGQGINTKVAQVCARELGIPLWKIQVKPTTNLASANSSVTGGSMGSELCAHAAALACKELMGRLEPIRTKKGQLPWVDLIKTAFQENIDLTSKHFYTKMDELKGYDIWGLACAEVEVDILTGEKQVLRVDVMEDVGVSMSPLVDVGQVEGAFIMGMGYWLQEKMKYHPDTGKNLSNSTWEYKPPTTKDIPIDFRITFLQDAPNPHGVQRSKATAEPPLCMSVCSLFAVRHAVSAARNDAGNTQPYLLAGPATNDEIQAEALTHPKDFKLR
ncbi:unnamed protein product [Darwinula stevensoni]|uniref:Indole-3-acetaldehyde oxidase n=1 Tax=Darwinula stevensoni TaxID=69355 RepID=A0A7R8X2T3_9CRUS|nr:unnamed protein product [Darwinula stevensoni]CAG0884273.1 unnamed protein product [Darwinula stevensoni]